MAEHAADLRGPRTLLVPGDAPRPRPWLEALRSSGFDVRVASGEGLAPDELDDIDVVIIGNAVSVERRAAILDELRVRDGPAIPVLFICADEEMASMTSLLEAPVTDVIRAPVEAGELLVRLRRLVRAGRTPDARLRARTGELLDHVLDALSYPLFVVDVEDHTILVANRAAGEESTVLGEKCHVVSHRSATPCDSKEHPCPIAVVRETRRPTVVEHTHCNLHGKPRNYEIRAYPLFDAEGNVAQMVESMVDVTSRKHAEQELRRKNRELTLLNSVITASMSEAGPDGAMAVACWGLRDAFELHSVHALLFDVGSGSARVAAAAAGTVAGDAVPGPPTVGHIVDLRALESLGRLVFGVDATVVDEVGGAPGLEADLEALSLCEVRALAVVPLALEGEHVGALLLGNDRSRRFDDAEVGLLRSVADQVAASLVRFRLGQTRRRLETAIEQSADGIVITDVNGVITYVNPAFTRVTGYAREEVIGRKPSILKSGHHDGAFYEDLWNTIVSGRTWHGRLVNRSKSGALFTEDAVITPVRDEAGQIVSFIGSKRDVTRELELEERMRQSQKMDSIGRLAGAVAHDFNNLLAVILGYAGLALGDLPPTHSAYESIKEIEDTTQRAAAVTRQLLTFARRQVTEARPLDLRGILANLDRMLERLIGEDVEMHVVAPDDLWHAKVDCGQLEQVVVNLIINARDAMPEGGRLVVRLENSNVAAEAPPVDGIRPGQYVEMSVQDTGVGMTDEVKAHLFEPFFTTKERERGTGLGLATCFGIVTQSGGYIWAESQLGEGTTVRVLLPRAEAPDDSNSLAPPESQMPEGTETVFVAEDEDNLRRLACLVLRQLGYRVLEAENGEAAMQVAESRIDDIDLLLTDVAMPKLSGSELARRLRERRPDLPVIFISGYTRDTSPLRNMAPDAELLTKPFSPAVLAKTIRQVLDRS